MRYRATLGQKTGFDVTKTPNKDKQEEAREAIHQGNLQIDKLIRKDLITVDMASSLVNDSDNVNDMIKKLIAVAELLYGKKDTLLEASGS